MLRRSWMLMLFIFPATVYGQTLPTQPCPSDALDATFQAMEDSGHSYTLAINLRNISGETCWVDNSPGGTGMAPDPTPDGTSVHICYYCENESRRPPEARITLKPGESVHQTRTWKTSTTDAAAKCVYLTEMHWDKNGELNSYFYLFSRSLLKPICSTLVTTNYTAGQFLTDTLTSLAPGSRMPSIRWANDEVAPYSRERIPLRVTVEDPSRVLLLDENSCPRLFVRTRDATPSRVIFSRLTRMDELQQVVCKTEPAGGAPGRFIMEFDGSYSLRSKENDQNKGEFTLDVSLLANIAGRYLFVPASQPKHFSMIDGKLIRRNWGPAVQGVRVALNLDKDLYVLGSDIPLHIAIENVDSRKSIAAMDPYYDPPGVGVEVLDSGGHAITPREHGGWAGHGFCHNFPSGLVFPIDLTLSQMGFRPNRPGIYTVVATWQPIVSDHCALFVAAPHFPDRLIVKSSPITFRIVNNPPPSEQEKTQKQ